MDNLSVYCRVFLLLISLAIARLKELKSAYDSGHAVYSAAPNASSLPVSQPSQGEREREKEIYSIYRIYLMYQRVLLVCSQPQQKPRAADLVSVAPAR